MKTRSKYQDKPNGYASIAKVLTDNNYPDVARITNEILQHSSRTGLSIEEILLRINNSEPWDYIRGYTEFCNNQFFVDRSVLIPRLETERLVEIALEVVKREATNNTKLEYVDVGTGSGCVLIAVILGLIQENRIKALTCSTGIDLSKEALETAKKNSDRLLDKPFRPNLISSDLLSEHTLNTEADLLLITANLPYVCEDEKNDLDPSVVNWEPHIALFDHNADGLGLTKKLLSQITRRTKNYIIIFEMDPDQVPIMKQHLGSRELSQIGFKYKFHKDQFKKSRFLEISSVYSE